jgi:isopentenyl diphosphate isomerase/L-lactate dehydrogenase-like FMN-dependent dehydrogenase
VFSHSIVKSMGLARLVEPLYLTGMTVRGATAAAYSDWVATLTANQRVVYVASGMGSQRMRFAIAGELAAGQSSCHRRRR